MEKTMRVTQDPDSRAANADSPTAGPHTETVLISCNVCGADAFQKLSLVDGWQIGRCGECGLIYLNPMPFFAPADEFSEMSLDFQYTRFQHNVTPEVLRHDLAQLRFESAEITRLSSREAGPGRFLDIGCGSGSSVRAAADLGWDATGVDIDPRLVEIGRTQLNVDLHCKPLLECDFPDQHFHFIRLRDVIEHLPNPYEVMCRIRRMLAPGGLVLIATPNEDSLPTQLRLLLGKKRSLVATVAPPHHVHGFAPKTLRRLLDRAELETLEMKTSTPVDPRYVTARNMQSARSPARVLAWRAANAIGKGSMLVGWARRKGDGS